MATAILAILNALMGSILTPLATAWTSYVNSKEAGFAVAAGADASIIATQADAAVKIAAMKVQLYGTPTYRLITLLAGIPPALHFGLVFIDTILASRFLYGHGVLGVPALPKPYDTFEWAIVSSFFLVHAVTVGTSNVQSWLGKK